MDIDTIRASLRRKDDEELLAIATARIGGYTEVARTVAEEIPSGRGIALTDCDREVARARVALHEEYEALRAGAERASRNDQMRRLGLSFIVLGVGAFVLPVFGYQFRILTPFGEDIPTVALALLGGGFLFLLLSSRYGRETGPSEGAESVAGAADTVDYAESQVPLAIERLPARLAIARIALRTLAAVAIFYLVIIVFAEILGWRN